ATGLIVTGALHEDGLADCADGLGATPERTKALEIMRDSRIGTYGALALIVSVGLRWTALATLLPATGFLALLIAHSASRGTISIAMHFSHYARDEGLGKMASGGTSFPDFMISLIVSVILAFVLGWISGLVALILGFLAAWLMLKYLEHRLGGYTGDGLGAMQQIAELTIIITLAGLWA
ncbi:MAG: adenosylcobinamide-GDP ribazoletransferase, partial [Pseudomonadota bacterium]